MKPASVVAVPPYRDPLPTRLAALERENEALRAQNTALRQRLDDEAKLCAGGVRMRRFSRSNPCPKCGGMPADRFTDVKPDHPHHFEFVPASRLLWWTTPAYVKRSCALCYAQWQELPADHAEAPPGYPPPVAKTADQLLADGLVVPDDGVTS